VKVCPRCSYVDTDGRRVCLACRGSLMGTPALELVDILEMREAALVGAGDSSGRAPWGPGLTALVDEAWNDVEPPEDDGSLCAGAAAPPDAPPAPVRSRGRASTGRFASALIDGVPMVPPPDPRPSAFEAAFDVRRAAAPDATPEDTSERSEPASDAAAETFVDDVFDVRPEAVLGVASGVRPGAAFAVVPDAGSDAPAATGIADPPQRPQDELAELTRRRLVKLYDARTAAAVLLDVDTPVNAPRPAATVRDETVRRSPRRSRRRALLAVVLVVVAVAAGRSLGDALRAPDQGRIGDVTTPIDKLPWRTVQSGPVRITAPGVPVGAGSSGYQRYALPDVDLMVTVRSPAPSLNSDVALRTYTSQLAAQLGGRLIEGFALVSSEGTGFSARLEVDGRTTLLYVLSAPGAVVEVRGDVHAGDPARPQAIFERTINAIEVR
jgi:hypothetical protein